MTSTTQFSVVMRQKTHVLELLSVQQRRCSLGTLTFMIIIFIENGGVSFTLSYYYTVRHTYNANLCFSVNEEPRVEVVAPTLSWSF